MKTQNNSSMDRDVPELTKEDPYQMVPGSAEALAYEMTDGHRDSLNSNFASTIKKHKHTGDSSERLNIFDLVGSMRRVSVAPAWYPINFVQQFAFYENAGTRRLYIYGVDQDGTGAWRYVALT